MRALNELINLIDLSFNMPFWINDKLEHVLVKFAWLFVEIIVNAFRWKIIRFV